jgi:NAD(P)-dependent dehydrogenase (short-subunit alcohol dehydrogenase family)
VARETLTVLARRSALAGRTAIVTGASGAFGSATMEVLKYLGAHPIGIDRKPGDGVLACDVTGFHVTDFLIAQRIHDAEGVSLAEHWSARPGPDAFRGTTTPGFPNLFVLTGPNTGLGTTPRSS